MSKHNGLEETSPTLVEPSLTKKGRVYTHEYRFLWQRSFDETVVIRLSKLGSKITLVLKTISVSSGVETRPIVEREDVQLSESDYDEFYREFSLLNFWEMPVSDGQQGLDGATWVFEAREEARYHVVTRWSPEKGRFRKTCLTLVRLSGYKPERVY